MIEHQPKSDSIENPTLRVITIDGPAGSGKSSTAREVARRLNFHHLDSGALYRAITAGLLRAGIPESRWEALDEPTLEELQIQLEPVETGFRVTLPGGVSNSELRSPEVTRRVSILAGIPAVRRHLVSLQRAAARSGPLVADGRDLGTVIFPDAPLKVFLTASLEERARRRLRQEGGALDPFLTASLEERARRRLRQEGGALDPAAVHAEIERIRERDDRDIARAVAPLRQAPDALLIDTTEIPFEKQVEMIISEAHARF